MSDEIELARESLDEVVLKIIESGKYKFQGKDRVWLSDNIVACFEEADIPGEINRNPYLFKNHQWFKWSLYEKEGSAALSYQKVLGERAKICLDSIRAKYIEKEEIDKIGNITDRLRRISDKGGCVFIGVGSGCSTTLTYACHDCDNKGKSTHTVFINEGDAKICQECGGTLERLTEAYFRTIK